MATVWRWTVEGTDAAGLQSWMSTMHYQTDVNPLGSEPDAAEVLHDLTDQYSTGGSGTGLERWLATVPSTVKLTRVSVYEELAAADTGVPQAASANYAYSGAVSVADAGIPFAMCVYVKFTTGFASRSSRGGTHLSPTLDQNHLFTDGLWDTTLSWWSANVSLAGYMKEVLSNKFGTIGLEGDYNPIIYSRTRRNRSEEPWTWQLATAVPSSTPRWLRRRDVGR